MLGYSEIPSGWEFQRLLTEADRVRISSYNRRPISTLAGLQIAPIRKGGRQKLLGKLYSGPAILCQPFPPSRPDRLYWRSVVRHNCSRQSKHAFRLQLAAGCMSCTLPFDRQCLRTLCMCARGSGGPCSGLHDGILLSNAQSCSHSGQRSSSLG